MVSFFYNLGKKAGPHIRKAKWMWQSATGTEADAIAAENQVGQDLAIEIRRQLQLDSEPKVTELLRRISSRLIPCLTNKLRRFSFETLKTGEPNAFALPGGYIFVTRSILELCQWNEDEIAFILSHEMAHVIKGHAMERIISNSAISIASKTLRVNSQISQWLKTTGIKLLESAYSQDNESDADELAIRLIVAAGYDPQAAVKLFSHLADLNPAQDQFKISSYFSSHPSLKVRSKNVKKLF